MVSDDGAVVLVFNGEIYNFLDLRNQLAAQGICFRGNSDTEVVLHLYLVKGEEMYTFNILPPHAVTVWSIIDNKPLSNKAGRERVVYLNRIFIYWK